MSRALALMAPAAAALPRSAQRIGRVAPSEGLKCGVAWSGAAWASFAEQLALVMRSGPKYRRRMTLGQSLFSSRASTSPAAVKGTLAYSQVERNELEDFASP